MIEQLPVLTPSVARGARTVSRCHGRLAARRRQVESTNRADNSRALAVERLLAAAICIAYLVTMVGDLLQIRGL